MNSRIVLVIVLAIVVLGYTAYTGYFSLKNSRQLGEVTRVIDGDTIELSDGKHVRLVGINAPEESEFFYNESKYYLKQLLDGKQVNIDVFGKDKYGRTLGYVYLDNDLINFEMIKNGFAHTYFFSSDEKFYLEFKKAEKEAKDKKLGIWKIVQQNCIAITNFHYNGKGNDKSNLNDEYVAFKNNCNNSIDMTGWEIKDEGTNIYKFKTFVLSNNSEFTLYSGSGKNSDKSVYWNSKQAIWNNDKDTLFLRDANGNLILSYGYPA